MNLSAEQVFLQAVYLVQQHKKYAAYSMFRNLSRLPGSNEAPNVWFWLARLSPDYVEAKKALLQAVELAPEDSQLPMAQAHFERRWRQRKFSSIAGLLTALSLFPFWLFTIYNLLLYPLLNTGQPVLYPHPFMENTISTAILIAFSLLIFGGTFLYCTTKARQRVTVFNFLGLNFFCAVFCLLLALAYFVLPLIIAFSLEYTYIGKITSPTTQQVFHLELENFRFRHSDTLEIVYKVYKCDTSGLFCQQLRQINPAIPSSPKSVSHPLNKNNYRLHFDETKQELSILYDDKRSNIENAIWDTIKL